MKALMTTALILVSCVFLDPVLAQPPKASSGASSVVGTIMQLEHDRVDAIMLTNLERLSQIIADDWMEVGSGGKSMTKESFLNSVRIGEHKLEACDFGPMDVKVLGNVAVVQGSVSETRVTAGQSNSFRVAFMDVFAKRGNRWVVVRSQATRGAE
jgi:hypothetical protein